jgi:hypothetical protein
MVHHSMFSHCAGLPAPWICAVCLLLSVLRPQLTVLIHWGNELKKYDSVIALPLLLNLFRSGWLFLLSLVSCFVYWCYQAVNRTVLCAGILGTGDLDSRAIDAIRGLSVTDALAVLAELRQTNLEHVSNKSAYLCGLIKTYRQKHRIAALNRNGSEVKV